MEENLLSDRLFRPLARRNPGGGLSEPALLLRAAVAPRIPRAGLFVPGCHRLSVRADDGPVAGENRLLAFALGAGSVAAGRAKSVEREGGRCAARRNGPLRPGDEFQLDRDGNSRPYRREARADWLGRGEGGAKRRLSGADDSSFRSLASLDSGAQCVHVHGPIGVYYQQLIGFELSHGLKTGVDIIEDFHAAVGNPGLAGAPFQASPAQLLGAT